MIILALRNTISIMGLILALPLLVIISFFIYLEDGWPIFFKQKRLGINKEEFMIFKIRTMKKNTPELGTHDVDKSFQLRLGKVIRAIKLDELPQLLSVIKGDMSLVGPRPALFNQSTLIALRKEHGVDKLLPGITGWAQVNGRDDLSIIDKVNLDKEYINLCSFWFDIRIMWLTLLKVLMREGVAH